MNVGQLIDYLNNSPKDQSFFVVRFRKDEVVIWTKGNDHVVLCKTGYNHSCQVIPLKGSDYEFECI